MIRMKNIQSKKKIRIVYMALLVLILSAGILSLMGDSSQAADEIYIETGGQRLDPAQSVTMNTRSMELMLRTTGTPYDDDRYRVSWTIEDTEARDVIASIEQSSNNKMIGIVRALSPGDVTITVTVRDTQDGGAVIGSTTCNIRVVFSVDTSVANDKFKYVNENDTNRSLVMYVGDPDVNLELNFGDASKTQWLSANDEVAKIEQRTGKVTAVGAGKTQITATYTPGTTGGTETYTAYLDVYVVPKVSAKNGPPYEKAQDVVMDSGGTLYTDTVFTNNLEVVRSKIVWVVKKDDGRGNSTVIADSLGQTSELISVTPSASRSNELRIEGMAGEYMIYFYAYGSYFSEDNCTEAYTPTVVRLTLKSTIKDWEEILHIGDSYDFAKAYNMTEEDFQKAFTVSVTASNGGSADNYASYNSSQGILTALAEGTVSAKIQVRKESVSYVKKLMGLEPDGDLPEFFTTKISIVDRVYLDRSNLTISVGQTYRLNLVLNSTYTGVVTWQSSNDRDVSVNETGLITGLRITTEDVTITASVDVGNGVIKTATCIVKVEAQVNGFTLSPADEQTMLVGEHITVVANIKQTVSVAPLNWRCSESGNPVFSVEPASDGKSAIITALRTGTADLVVENLINPDDRQSIRITVRSAIQTIDFLQSELSVEYYKEGYNMKNEVKYTPANATDTSLTWVSSDTSVLTVDADGYLEFKGPGTALVTVYPTYNPYNVMDSCLVTVIASADGLSFKEEDKDITMNVGDIRTLPVTYLIGGKESENAAADLTWMPTPEGIVKVSWDEKVRLATITAEAPGQSYINITSPQTGTSTIRVTVKQPSTDITVQPASLTVMTGESANLQVSFTPANSTDTLTFSSYNTSVAKVDANGRVTGVKSGTTFIQVNAYNGKEPRAVKVVQVVVRDGLKGIALDSYEKTVYVGSSITIAPIFNPVTAFNKEVKWSSVNNKIASVAASGVSNVKVTGVKAGTTLVTGVATDGGFSVSCLITVKNKPSVNNTKVSVSPGTKYLKKGKSFYVKATVTGSSNKKVKWSTSKKKVATVSSSGKVKGKKIGTAYIKATAKDGSGAYARCKVRVVRRITKLSLNKYSARLLVGSTMKLKAKIKPKNATVKKLKWTTSDKAVATVSGGRVMGLSEGMVRIKAKTTDGSNKSRTCIIRVMEPVDATGVDVANSEITVAKGKSIQSGIKVSPANATTKIKYHSDNKKVATVDKYGKIRTKRAGQATIYGKTANGKIGYCDVLVVDLNRKGLVMRQYDTEQLSVNLIKDGVTWYSKNINIATVSSSGLVTGRKKGTTIIYANVNGVKLGCRVRIKKIK